MRLVLDVKDEKAAFLLEILRNFKFVKLDEASSEKASILESIANGLKEVQRAEKGELKLENAKDWLNGL